jgi:DNA-binding MarR family transcriptional regulator
MRIELFLQQSPIFQTSRIARRMDAALGAALASVGLSVFESMVLAAIFFERHGEIKPSELADAFETTRGNMSHCISSLEAKGLVVRRVHPDDARALQLLLKPQGRRMAVRVVGILDQMQRQIEDAIGVTKLAAALEELKRVEQECVQTVQPQR